MKNILTARQMVLGQKLDNVRRSDKDRSFQRVFQNTPKETVNAIETIRPDDEYKNSNTTSSDVGLGNVTNPSIVTNPTLTMGSWYRIAILDELTEGSSAEFVIKGKEDFAGSFRFVVSIYEDAGIYGHISLLTYRKGTSLISDIAIDEVSGGGYVIIKAASNLAAGCLTSIMTCEDGKLTALAFTAHTLNSAVAEIEVETDDYLPGLKKDVDQNASEIGYVAGDLSDHEGDTNNPHGVDANGVGLGNVLNPSSNNITSITAGNWYRIAQLRSGKVNGLGHFTVRSAFTSPGNTYQTLRFQIAIVLDPLGYLANITLLNQSGTDAFDKVAVDVVSGNIYICIRAKSTLSHATSGGWCYMSQDWDTLDALAFTAHTLTAPMATADLDSDDYIPGLKKDVFQNASDISDVAGDLSTHEGASDPHSIANASLIITNKTIDCDPAATEANLVKNALVVKKVTVNWRDTSPKDILTVLDGYIIDRVYTEVTETWDGTAPAFEVGDNDDPDGYIRDLGINLASAGYYGLDGSISAGVYTWDSTNKYNKRKAYSGSKTIKATFSAGSGASQGECVVYVIFVQIK